MKKQLGIFTALLFAGSLSHAAIYITEIMYNPGPTIPEPSGEFVELYNTPGGGSVDIQNWTVEDAISGPQNITASSFVLAPGSFLVLSDLSLAAFNSNYNVALTTSEYIQVAGGLPTLNNTGDDITIRDSGAGVQASISYGVSGPWPTASEGHSISFNNPPDLAPPGAYTLAGNWSLSEFADAMRSGETADPGGFASPGRLDVVPEPSSLGLLGLGALALYRSRRNKRK